MGGGRSKAFERLAGKTVIEWSVRPFLQRDISCVITARGSDREEMIGLFAGIESVSVVEGGATRGESVAFALAHITDRFSPQPANIVLVHDAARCLVSVDLLDRVITETRISGAAVPGISITDTLKTVDQGRKIVDTVDRSSTIAVQTPQGFHYQLIAKAYDKGNINATDDCGLVEQFRPVSWVEGERQNFKITHPQDLALAGFLLSLPEKGNVR